MGRVVPGSAGSEITELKDRGASCFISFSFSILMMVCNLSSFYSTSFCHGRNTKDEHAMWGAVRSLTRALPTRYVGWARLDPDRTFTIPRRPIDGVLHQVRIVRFGRAFGVK